MPLPESQAIVRMWALAQPLVAGFISAAVRNYADAQDILQEVAVAVFGNAETVSRISSEEAFKSWAISITRNKLADHFRRKSREPAIMDEGLLDAVARRFAEEPERWRKESDAFEQCLRHVKGDARQLLEMRYQEGHSLEEMARRLNRTAVAVRVSLHRVRTALRDCVERRMGLKAPEGTG